MTSIALYTLNTIHPHFKRAVEVFAALTQQYPAYPSLSSIHPLFHLEYIGKLLQAGCLGTICVTAVKGHYDIPRGKTPPEGNTAIMRKCSCGSSGFLSPLSVGLHAEFHRPFTVNHRDVHGVMNMVDLHERTHLHL